MRPNNWLRRRLRVIGTGIALLVILIAGVSVGLNHGAQQAHPITAAPHLTVGDVLFANGYTLWLQDDPVAKRFGNGLSPATIYRPTTPLGGCERTDSCGEGIAYELGRQLIAMSIPITSSSQIIIGYLAFSVPYNWRNLSDLKPQDQRTLLKFLIPDGIKTLDSHDDPTSYCSLRVYCRTLFVPRFGWTTVSQLSASA
jgi:hypothetical protein